MLKKYYFFLALPAACLFSAFYLAKGTGLVRAGQFHLSPVWHAILFIVSAMAAIAGPVLIRTLFAHTVRVQTRVSADTFIRFQKRLIRVSMVTPYLALIAMACDFPRFHSAAIVLMALYALYYYFPSDARINFDRNIFRVK